MLPSKLDRIEKDLTMAPLRRRSAPAPEWGFYPERGLAGPTNGRAGIS